MIFILLFAIFSCGGSDENVKEENSSNIEKTDVKTENQENSSKNSNNIQGERYGNETVGYITKPENWLDFTDPNASPTLILFKNPRSVGDYQSHSFYLSRRATGHLRQAPAGPAR